MSINIFNAQMSKENYQLKTCPPFIVKYALILAPKTAYFYYSFILTDFLTYIPAREGSLILQWTLSVGRLEMSVLERGGDDQVRRLLHL